MGCCSFGPRGFCGLRISFHFLALGYRVYNYGSRLPESPEYRLAQALASIAALGGRWVLATV